MGQAGTEVDWLVKEVEIRFGPSAVAQPVVWEMTRTHEVVFSLMQASVDGGVGRMRLKLAGPRANLAAAERFLASRGAELNVLSSGPGSPPQVWPPQAESSWVGQKTVERKLWLTFGVHQIDKPLLWEMSRRFDATFDIRQASVSGDLGIVGLLLKGPQTEVDGACQFLRQAGLTVEPIDRDAIEG